MLVPNARSTARPRRSRARRTAAPVALSAVALATLAVHVVFAPVAVAASKALARHLGPVIDDAVIDDSVRRLADTWETADAREGIAAFFEKRKAGWVG